MMRRILFFVTFLLVGNGAWTQQQQEEQEDDRGVIRLNPNDPTLDAWKELRDTSNDPKREPGPINIQRMSGGQGWTGIPTFFMLPVALTPEDVTVGEVDVAIMGALLDTGSGMRGAAFGPKTLRGSDKYLGWGSWSDPHLHVMVDWMQDLTVVDYGDAPIDNMSAERSMRPCARWSKRSRRRARFR